MGPRATSLRTILSAVTTSVTVLALGIAVTLVLVTDSLHRTSSTLASAIESFRLADDAKVDLLLHGRAHDAVVRRDIEASLRSKFAEARRYVTTEAEGAVLDRADASVERYFQASHRPGAVADKESPGLDEAYVSLEELVGVNVRQAALARENANRSHSLARTLGIGLGVLILGLSGWLLWWLRLRAFRPVLALAAAFERFARGEREIRADLSGPAELRDMTQRFNDMAAALASQRQAQISFLGGVAHDFRTPINAVKLSVASFRGDGPLPPEGTIRKAVEVVRRQVARLERMTGDFLEIARIEAGKLDLQLQWHDARAVVRDVQELFESSSPEHRLAVTLPPDEILLWCDPLRLEQVLTNLISNAIKYSPGAPVVQVTLERSGDTTILSVTDAGIGISEEDLQRLFEPFRRVGLSRETVPGVGLGLFVVQQIVRGHGGRLAVESALGKGTQVRVFLPQAARASTTRARQTPSPITDGPGQPGAFAR